MSTGDNAAGSGAGRTENGIDRRSFLAGAAGTAGLTGLAGCLNDALGGGSDSIVFGIPVPTSGPPAVYGNESVEAVEYAIESQFDGEIGGKTIETVVRDTKGDPGVAVPAATELITEEDADVLLGGYVSASCLGIMDVAKREGVPYIPQATSVQITGENCNRYTFHHSPNSRQNAASVLAAYENDVFDTLHIHHADLAGERDMADATEATLESTDAEIVGRTTFPEGNNDFSPGISAVEESGADAVFFIYHLGGVISFLSQAIQSGLKGEVEFIFPMVSPQLTAGVGEEAAEGVYGTNFFYWNQEGVGDFSDRYMESSGHRPRWWEAGSYEGAMELLSAIDREGGSTDADGIISQLEGREFDWVRPSRWRACDHLSITDMLLLRGKAPDEKNEEDDYFEVAGSKSADVATLPCSEKACEME
jgi:branched-chain amino acid transport system substrate-binding protein